MKEVDLVKGQMDYPELNIAVEPPNHSLDVTVQSWDSRLRSFLGVTAGMIVTTSKGKSKYNIFFRLPLFWSTALNCRVETYWPSWSHLSIAPLLKIQHIISENSITLAACIRDDVPELRNLLLSGKAHPNDTTLDNETLLYVGHPLNIVNSAKKDQSSPFAQTALMLLNCFLNLELTRILHTAAGKRKYTSFDDESYLMTAPAAHSIRHFTTEILMLYDYS